MSSNDWLYAEPTALRSDMLNGPLARFRAYAAELGRQAPGSRLSVLAPMRSAQPDSFDLAANCTINVVPLRTRWMLGFALSRALNELAARRAIDLVTTQTPFDDGLTAARIAATARCALVAQIHVDLFSASWRAEHWFNRVRYGLARSVCRRADAVRVVSASLRDCVIARWGLTANRVYCIPVGVTLEPFAFPDPAARAAFRRTQLGLERGDWAVLFVGALYRPKNLELLAATASYVCRALPQARFLIVGDGPERQKVMSLCRQLCDQGRVRFLGWLSGLALAQVYAAADAFLLTSSHESYSRVLVEAQQAGIPVVTTPTSAALEHVRDGKNGLVVEPDPERVGAALTRLHADRGLRERLGAEAQRSAAHGGITVTASRVAAMWIEVAQRSHVA